MCGNPNRNNHQASYRCYYGDATNTENKKDPGFLSPAQAERANEHQGNNGDCRHKTGQQPEAHKVE